MSTYLIVWKDKKENISYIYLYREFIYKNFINRDFVLSILQLCINFLQSYVFALDTQYSLNQVSVVSVLGSFMKNFPFRDNTLVKVD